MDKVDTIIIGGGVVGLAIAAKLSARQQVIVIDKEARFGEHSSSRNSEVIHAGIYYPTASLKHQLCIRGKALLYEHCRRHHIAAQPIGKYIIASSPAEAEQLANVYRQAQQNGVTDIRYLSPTEQQQLDYLNMTAGLYSPSTGILDSHQFMLSLLSQIEGNGGVFASHTELVATTRQAAEHSLQLRCHDEDYHIRCDTLINAAGLEAPNVLKRIAGGSSSNAKAFYCRGRYYRYQGKHPFTSLVYPLPNEHGLGVHATLDLAGQLKFGPDTQYIDGIDYHFDDSNKAQFAAAIQDYWPGLDPSRLVPDYTGIRPKLSAQQSSDFVIEFAAQHGIAGLVSLMAIESPGLTASLAIAEYIDARL